MFAPDHVISILINYLSRRIIRQVKPKPADQRNVISGCDGLLIVQDSFTMIPIIQPEAQTTYDHFGRRHVKP